MVPRLDQVTSLVGDRGSAMLHLSRRGRPPQSTHFQTTAQAFPRVLMAILDPLAPLLESFHLVAAGQLFPQDRELHTPSPPIPPVCSSIPLSACGTMSHFLAAPALETSKVRRPGLCEGSRRRTSSAIQGTLSSSRLRAKYQSQCSTATTLATLLQLLDTTL